MAISTDPAEYKGLPSVVLYSDAENNDAAIREMDAWAREHGYVRTNEYHLNVVIRNNLRIFQGFCYKWTEENKEAAKRDLSEIRSRRAKMPLTAPSDEILRDADSPY